MARSLKALQRDIRSIQSTGTLGAHAAAASGSICRERRGPPGTGIPAGRKGGEGLPQVMAPALRALRLGRTVDEQFRALVAVLTGVFVKWHQVGSVIRFFPNATGECRWAVDQEWSLSTRGRRKAARKSCRGW